MKLATVEALTVTKVTAAPHKLSAIEKISAFKWLLLVQTLFLVVVFGGIAALFLASPHEPLQSHGPLSLLANNSWLLPTLCITAILLFTGINVHWIVSQNIATIDEVKQSSRELAEKFHG